MSENSFKKFLFRKINNSNFRKILSLTSAIFILLILYRSEIVAPMFVNGEAVTIADIIYSYNKGGVKGLKNRLLEAKILEIEAKKRNIIITKDEIDSELNRAEEEAILSGLTLKEILDNKDQSLSDYQRELKTRLTIYKILSQSTTMDDDAIDKIMEENKWLYNNEKEAEEVREELRKLLIDTQYQFEYQKIIKEAKADSKVNYIFDFK